MYHYNLSLMSWRITYQENKENKEHVGDEVDRPENSVCTINGIVIKVSEDDPELGETAGEMEKKW